MGQKTNPNIFRLGIKTNDWKHKYFENASEEYSFYSFQSIKIKNFLERLLSFHGLFFHNYRLKYVDNTIYLFISYCTSYKAIYFINKTNFNPIIKIIKKPKSQKFKKYKNKKLKYPKRILILKKLKKKINRDRYNNNIKKLNANNFVAQLLESLSIFTKKKYNIVITLRNLNRQFSTKLNTLQIKSLNKKLIQLRQYSRYYKKATNNYDKKFFFKEAINILIRTVTIKKSAKFFADFVAAKLTPMKRHNFFLMFLKHALMIFIKTNFSKINGIKIGIKGRFNGAPRAKNKIILIGQVPIQTLNSKIDYYQSTAFTRNGTFGVKVWICEI